MLTLNDGRNELWQWDTGRKLTVDADCSQVHFSNKVFGRSIDVDVIEGTATIPDVLLQTDKELTAWAFAGTAENGYTKIEKTFKVNRRNKPADYVFTPPEQTSLGELIERLDKIEEEQIPDAVKNAVEDYMEKNPVEAPVHSVNGKTGEVNLTSEDVGAISQDDLQEATNKALAQAKESGEFDGADGSDASVTADNIAAALGYTPANPEECMAKSDPVGTGSLSLNRKEDTTVGYYSVAEGDGTTASGRASHAEGQSTTASGVASHAEGRSTNARGDYSHAEGDGSKAEDYGSHAEGYSTTASGRASHAEGWNTIASDDSSHAEGYGTIASGVASHAEGEETTASGYASHAEGLYTIAHGDYQHVQGKYNKTEGEYAHIVGNGTSDTARSNAHTLDWNGNAWYQGSVKVGGTSYDDADNVATESYVDEAIKNVEGTMTFEDLTPEQKASLKGDKGDKGDTGATGPAGYTPKKNVDYFDGKDGKDGVSATHAWNGTVLTIKSASGTSSADLRGAKGDKGDTGANGSDASVTAANIAAALGYTPANSTHNQGANTITAGTFAGQVVANGSEQAVDTFLLRNSKLASAEENPTFDGEICWIYE